MKPGQANTFNPAGNSTPIPVSQAAVDAMMAALPTTPGAKPIHARKVLVLAHTGAGGFVHASIPLAAKTVEALGNQGDLWTTTVSYDAADINTENLKKYDAIFLDSTTACFLDDPNPAVTAARRAAFLAIRERRKGRCRNHAATDSYHTDWLASEAAAKSGSPGGNLGALVLAARLVTAADKDNDETVSRQEWPRLRTIGSRSWIPAIRVRSLAPISWRISVVVATARPASSRPGIEACTAMAGIQHADWRILQIPLG